MNRIILRTREGNEIIVSEIPGLKLKFYGKDNQIIIDEGIRFINCSINLNSNNKIRIRETRYSIQNARFFLNSNNIVDIGKNFSCLEIDCRLQENGTGLIIGEDCMFSSEIRIYASDGHAIYSIKDSTLSINPGKIIKIGNHVWIGRRVALLKSTIIQDNSIVGFGSIVTKSFSEPNVVIAGYPAKIIKSQVSWDRRPPEEYTRYFKKKNEQSEKIELK